MDFCLFFFFPPRPQVSHWDLRYTLSTPLPHLQAHTYLIPHVVYKTEDKAGKEGPGFHIHTPGNRNHFFPPDASVPCLSSHPALCPLTLPFIILDSVTK